MKPTRGSWNPQQLGAVTTLGLKAQEWSHYWKLERAVAVRDSHLPGTVDFPSSLSLHPATSSIYIN